MRTYWLALMWMARGLMLFCVADLAWGLASGESPSVITSLICLPINAATAEFSRRRMT